MSGHSHALFSNSDRAAAHLDRLMKLGSVGNDSLNIHNLSNDTCFWFRLVQKSPSRSPVSRLLRFLYSVRSGANAHLSSSHGFPHDDASTVRSESADKWPALFPMHLPAMPASLRVPGSTLRGRRLQRWKRRKTAWLWTEHLIAYFNCFEMWCPKAKKSYDLGRYSVTGEQALAFDRLFDVVLGFLRSGKALNVAPGRGIAHAIDTLGCISIDDPNTNSNHKTWEAIAASSVALPISVSDVEKTTPTQAGNIRPEDHLLHGRGNQFLDIQSRILDPPPLASAIPKGCYLVSQDDETPP